MSARSGELIEILCDGGAHGLGHLSRSSALAAALLRRGRRVKLSALSDEGTRLLGDRHRDETGSPSLCVLDLPYEIESAIGERRQLGIPTVALDYFGDAVPDLVISVLERRFPPPAGKRLCGFEYAIVRPEIVALAPAAEGSGVLVLMGGGDVLRCGPAVAVRLAEIGERVTLVEGPRAPASQALPGVETLRAPSNLPARMAGCGWAVTNGGVTMTELMCLGKAVHVIPQTDDEDRLARRLLAAGAVLDIGGTNLVVPNAERRLAVGAVARRIFDGLGAERIADEIGKLS